MVFKHFDWLSTSKSEALFTSWPFFNMANKNRIFLFTHNTKCSEKAVKLFNN